MMNEVGYLEISKSARRFIVSSNESSALNVRMGRNHNEPLVSIKKPPVLTSVFERKQRFTSSGSEQPVTYLDTMR